MAGYALAKAQRRDEAKSIVEDLKTRSNQRYIPSYNMAAVIDGLGDRDEALNQLEKGFETRDARMI